VQQSGHKPTPRLAWCPQQTPLATGSLAKVAVVVLGADGAPLERFVVEPRVGLEGLARMGRKDSVCPHSCSLYRRYASRLPGLA
jgi:hypothetical protein